jgi:hypothetical protein
VQTFDTTVGDLLVLRDWLAAHGVTHVAMESTGLMVGRGLDALAERVTAERVAPIVTRVLGLWHTQNRVFALWRDHPEARDALRPLVDALGFALAGRATP